MSSSEPIGGFFELELSPQREWLHSGAILLNSGRAGFEYVLRARRPKHVYMPKYTCDVMLEPLERTGTSYSFYQIDETLEIAQMPDPAIDELLVYTNYFGLKDSYSRSLAQAFGPRLLLDCSQAIFSPPPTGSHSLYSPRKFVGAPDGGCLYTDGRLTEALVRDISSGRYEHLIGRIDEGPEAVYASFKSNDASLSGLLAMSHSTERLLQAIDYDRIKAVRNANFHFLHGMLGSRNRLPVGTGSIECPMVYPFLPDRPGLRDRLLAERIFVATYWPNVLKWCGASEYEHHLASNLLPLPIDQRYGRVEMERIASLLSH